MTTESTPAHPTTRVKKTSAKAADTAKKTATIATTTTKKADRAAADSDPASATARKDRIRDQSSFSIHQ